MSGLKVSDVRALKKNLKREYKSSHHLFQRTFHYPPYLKKLRTFSHSLLQSDPGRMLNAKELRFLLDMALKEPLQASEAAPPFDQYVRLAIANIFELKKETILAIQGVSRSSIQGPRDSDIHILESEIDANLSYLEKLNLLTLDNCKMLFSQLTHIVWQNRILHFCLENKIALSQESYGSISEIKDVRFFHKIIQILEISHEWGITKLNNGNQILLKILQLSRVKLIKIDHAIACLQRLQENSSLQTEENFRYAISLPDANEFLNALVQLRKGNKLSQVNIRNYVRRKLVSHQSEAKILDPLLESDALILSTIDQPVPDFRDRKRTWSKLKEITEDRRRSLASGPCIPPTKMKRSAVLCMSAETQAEIKALSWDQTKEDYATITEIHEIRRSLKRQIPQTMSLLSQMYITYQTGNILASGNSSAVKWTLGSVGMGLGGRRVENEIKLFKNSRYLPIKGISTLSPLLGKGISSLPILFDLKQAVKKFKQGDESAILDIAEDSSWLGLDAWLSISEIMAIETAPLEETLNFLIVTGFQGYRAEQVVASINQRLHLNTFEKFEQWMRLFFNLGVSPYLEQALIRKENNEAITLQKFNEIKDIDFIDTIIYSLGHTIKIEERKFTGNWKVDLPALSYIDPICCPDHRISFYCETTNNYQERFEHGNNTIIFNNNNQQMPCPDHVRTCPFDGNSDLFNFLCLPISENDLETTEKININYQGLGSSIDTSIRLDDAERAIDFCKNLNNTLYDQKIFIQYIQGHLIFTENKDNFCYNSVILSKKNGHPNHVVLVSLGHGNKYYQTKVDKAHIFQLEGGWVNLKSLSKNDTFIIHQKTCGYIDAGLGNNTLHLKWSGQPTENLVVIDLNLSILQQGNCTLNIIGLNHISGSSRPETIILPQKAYLTNNATYVIDGGGGGDTIQSSEKSPSFDFREDSIPAIVLLNNGDYLSISNALTAIIIKDSFGTTRIENSHLKNNSPIPIYLKQTLRTILSIDYFNFTLEITFHHHQEKQKLILTHHPAARKNFIFITQEHHIFYPILPESHTLSHPLLLPIEILIPSDNNLRSVLSLVPAKLSSIVIAGSPQKLLILGSDQHDLLKIKSNIVYVEGRNGSDTYRVFKKKGRITINNYAIDRTMDTLDFSSLSHNDSLYWEAYYNNFNLHFLWKEKNRSSVSLDVELLNFTQHSHYQHMQIIFDLRKPPVVPIIPAVRMKHHRAKVQFKINTAYHRLIVQNMFGITSLAAQDMIKYQFYHIDFSRLFSHAPQISYYKTGTSLLIFMEDLLSKNGLLITQFYDQLLPQLEQGSLELHLWADHERIATTNTLISTVTAALSIDTLLINEHRNNIVVYPMHCCSTIKITHTYTSNLSSVKMAVVDFKNSEYEYANISAYKYGRHLILSINDTIQTVVIEKWNSAKHMPMVFKWPAHATIDPILLRNIELEHVLNSRERYARSNPFDLPAPEALSSISNSASCLRSVNTLISFINVIGATFNSARINMVSCFFNFFRSYIFSLATNSTNRCVSTNQDQSVLASNPLNGIATIVEPYAHLFMQYVPPILNQTSSQALMKC